MTCLLIWAPKNLCANENKRRKVQLLINVLATCSKEENTKEQSQNNPCYSVKHSETSFVYSLIQITHRANEFVSRSIFICLFDLYAVRKRGLKQVRG